LEEYKQNKNMKIFSCVALRELATQIALEIGIPHGDCKLSSFKDGELSPHYNETVRGQDVFIVGSSAQNTIMETLLMIDAAKRSAAGEITVVLPYYGYSRQDRKEGIRGPVGAKLVADLLTVAGADKIMTIDLHAAQIQGFFNIPFDHISGHIIFTVWLKTHGFNVENNWIVCAPDAGGFQRAAKIAEKLGLQIVAINKRRDKPNSIGSMELVGDVKGKNVLIVDDIVDTAGTLCSASEHLSNWGANEIVSVCTHGVLSDPAIERIENCKTLSSLIISDSVPLKNKVINCSKIKIVSCATVLAKVIEKSVNKESINEVVD
jgi:ribose-phosphate pyrophosphokinase